MSQTQKGMIKAAKAGDTGTIRSLLAVDASLIAAVDGDGSTPLHCAAWKGHIEAVRTLLDAGAEVNAHNANDHWGTTPLHAAAHANQAAIVELLLERGADPRAVDMNGLTPMEHTTFHKARAAARLLQQFETE